MFGSPLRRCLICDRASNRAVKGNLHKNTRVCGQKLSKSNNRPGPLVHFLYEPGAGGLDRVAILLANGMAERGLDTELWLTKTSGPLSRLISDKVVVRTVPAPPIGSRGFQLFAQIPALARMLDQHRPTAVFSAGNQSNLSLALARKLAPQSGSLVIQKITNPIVRPGMGGWRAARSQLAFQGDCARGRCYVVPE